MPSTAEEEDTAASALLLKHEFLDGGADDVTLATLGEVLLEPTLTTLGNFLVRSNSQSSVASASFAVGGFQLEGYAMTLSAFAWNIVRTYTLTPGRRYSFGCRQRGRQRLRGRLAELLQLFDSVEAKQYKRPDMNGDLRLGFASDNFAGTKWILAPDQRAVGGAQGLPGPAGRT